MGRSKATPVPQPDDLSCGPSALKVALEIVGKRKSLSYLYKLCKTNNNGVTTKHMIEAINKLGFSVEVVEYATLHHLQSALRYPANHMRASMVSYLSELDQKDRPHPESGHWATVASYAASKSRIILFDSSSGGSKTSYAWSNFRTRWMDYDYKRRKIGKRGKFKLVKKWQQQLLLVIAKDENDLPWFRIDTSRVFSPTHAS
jgi:ABC-type bacteriocin/lantibiotic exporter with double-glycine peptidase domain